MDRRLFVAGAAAALVGTTLAARAEGDSPPSTTTSTGSHARTRKGRDPWWEIYDASRDLGRWWGRMQGWMFGERLRLGRILGRLERRLKDKRLSKSERRSLEALDRQLRKRFNRMVEILTGNSAAFVKGAKAVAGPNPWERARTHTKAAEKAANDYRNHMKKGRPSTAERSLREARKQLAAAHRILDRARAQFAKELNGAARDIAKARRAGVAADLMSEKTEKAMRATAGKLERSTVKGQKPVKGVVILE